MSRRTEMLGSTIQKELAQVIMRELHDPRLVGMPSITRVKVSQDLSLADVYVTVMGTPGQQTAALNALRHSAGLMRSRLTKALTLRVAPFLKFHIDENLKKELEIMGLLDKVSKENAEIDRRRAEEAAAAGEAAAGEAAGPSGESPAGDAPAPAGAGAGEGSAGGAAEPAPATGPAALPADAPRARAGDAEGSNGQE